MGERADGDEVDACLRNAADRLERDPTRRLGRGAAGDQLHSVAELARRHVVEQDRLGSAFERGAYIVERLALDLHPQTVPLSATHGFGDTACEPYVVVLDQDRVEEAEAVVGAAARTDRELLERAEPGRRLARVEDLCIRAGDGVDVAASQCR